MRLATAGRAPCDSPPPAESPCGSHPPAEPIATRNLWQTQESVVSPRLQVPLRPGPSLTRRSGALHGPPSHHCAHPHPAPRDAQFVLFLAYMPITSASLRALDCVAPIDGVAYLRTDLRVTCARGEHAVASIMSFVVLAVFGAGFPIGLYAILSRASAAQLANPQFQSAWGFLYAGYRSRARKYRGSAPSPLSGVAPQPLLHIRANSSASGDGLAPEPETLASPPRPSVASVDTATTEQTAEASAALRRALMCGITSKDVARGHLLWWESVVLVRKAGIVLLAVLVTDPYWQCAGATLILGACFAAQLKLQPYADKLFNLLETASLASSTITSVISTLLLQSADTNAAAGLPPGSPPPAMTGSEWLVTIALLLLNLGTMGMLVGVFLFLQLRQVRDKVVSLRRKTASPSAFAASPLAVPADVVNPMLRGGVGPLGSKLRTSAPDPAPAGGVVPPGLRKAQTGTTRGGGVGGNRRTTLRAMLPPTMVAVGAGAGGHGALGGGGILRVKGPLLPSSSNETDDSGGGSAGGTAKVMEPAASAACMATAARVDASVDAGARLDGNAGTVLARGEEVMEVANPLVLVVEEGEVPVVEARVHV
jgi:hypothetical protein